MPRMHLTPGVEQVANHVREELLSGRWTEILPGRARLAAELGVSGKLVEAGLARLEKEGLLVSQGPRRRRKIILPKSLPLVRPLRVKILPYEDSSRALPYNNKLVESLQEAGFNAGFTTKSLHDLNMDVRKVERFVGQTPADAWVVNAASRAVNEWFARQPIPAMAMFGRFRGLPIAACSTRKAPALAEAVRQLVALGHRRIVMLVREERRKPYPAFLEQVFLDELDACGITPSQYNLPGWEDSPAGFHRCLDSLFQHTPPTALIISEPKLFVAAQQRLSRMGIQVPEDVSLICDDPDEIFTWCAPLISHIQWDHRPVARRVVKWAKNIARGQEDRRQTLIKAKFVEGGTIGPMLGSPS